MLCVFYHSFKKNLCPNGLLIASESHLFIKVQQNLLLEISSKRQ